MVRLLVAEGNSVEGSRRIAETSGATPAAAYAEILRSIAPGAHIDICMPAETDAKIPGDLGSYDGVAITGSSLNIYQREPAALRQVDFLREVFTRGIPSFGSCWGLQLAAVAAGGEVAANPRGREVAFARKITLTEEGQRHAMHSNRPLSFDAPAIHVDEVVHLPEGAIVTATNDVSQIQAAEIRFGKGVFWGVQYHPEYNFHDIAATMRRYGVKLVDEGFFEVLADLERFAADLDILQGDRTRRDIAWRFGLGAELIDDRKRICEIANWFTEQVLPTISARGRQ
jgi:GMP synthase (glutamine-hydrolysing)